MTRQQNPRCLALRFVRGAFAVWLAATAVSALAHDTWFEAKRRTATGDIIVALGTGNMFPLQEFPISASLVAHHGCRQGDAPIPFAAVTNSSTALLLRAIPTSREPATCWAQLTPSEIELPLDKVEVYLAEINASPEVRATWLAMQTRNLPWIERYTKHARIEFAGEAQVDGSVLPARPVDMGMDMLIESGLQPIRAGDSLVIQVLRDGAPLANFAVELRSDRGDNGIWRTTDLQGRIRVDVTHPGRWVLRGTDLRLSPTEIDTWESGFVTLAFNVEVALPATQK